MWKHYLNLFRKFQFLSDVLHFMDGFERLQFGQNIIKINILIISLIILMHAVHQVLNLPYCALIKENVKFSGNQ